MTWGHLETHRILLKHEFVIPLERGADPWSSAGTWQYILWILWHPNTQLPPFIIHGHLSCNWNIAAARSDSTEGEQERHFGTHFILLRCYDNYLTMHHDISAKGEGRRQMKWSKELRCGIKPYANVHVHWRAEQDVLVSGLHDVSKVGVRPRL